MSIDREKYLSVQEAATFLGITRNAVTKLMRAGTLKGFKPGIGKNDAWLVDRESVQAHHDRYLVKEKPGRRGSKDLRVAALRDRLPAERPMYLTDRQWEIVQARVVDQLSYDAIATRYKLSYQYVHSVFRAALSKLEAEGCPSVPTSLSQDDAAVA